MRAAWAVPSSMSNVLGVDMGMFYKRRDYTRIVNGKNPIVAHEFLGADVEGKDVIIIDDMISSGDSMLDVATRIKKTKGTQGLHAAATFGLFHRRYGQSLTRLMRKVSFDHLLTTNLVYQTPELLQKPYYVNCDMSKYIAYIIDTLNHDTSISSLLSPLNRINKFLKEHNNQ